MPSSSIHLISQKGCRLAIGAYPAFSYDARGGGGKGVLGPINKEGRKKLSFDPEELIIPSLNWRNTKLLGLPIPPSLKISVKTKLLSGTLSPKSGELKLQFDALFQFTVGSWISAPNLIVNTYLTTGKVKSHRHEIEGQTLKVDGNAILVGVAKVPLCGAVWLDQFLGLPDEALAVLRCNLVS